MSSDDVYSAYGDEGMDEFDRHVRCRAERLRLDDRHAGKPDSPAASWASAEREAGTAAITGMTRQPEFDVAPERSHCREGISG